MRTCSSGMEAGRSNCGETNSVPTMTDRQIRTCKGMLLSLVFHAFCVAVILFSGNLSAQYSETPRVFLTLEPPGGSLEESRQETAAGKKTQSLPIREKLSRQSPIRKARSSDPAPAVDRASVEPAKEAVPLLDKTPIETAAPLKAVGSGAHEESVASVAGAGIGAGSSSRMRNGADGSEGAGKGRESREGLKSRYLREHFAYIRDLILKNLTYPPMARKNGWQGKVKVSFMIREDGKVETIRIVESSGYVVLDRNVVETIREVQPFPKPPVRAELVIPVTYALKT